MEQPKIYGPQLVPDVPREGTSQGTQSSNDFLEKYPQVLLEEIQNTVCQRKISRDLNHKVTNMHTNKSEDVTDKDAKTLLLRSTGQSCALMSLSTDFEWPYFYTLHSHQRDPKKYDKTMMLERNKPQPHQPFPSNTKIATSKAWPYRLQRSFYSAGAFVKTGVSPGALTASRACHEETFTSKWGHVFCVYLIIGKKDTFFGSSKKSSHWMMWVWKNVLANLGDVFFVKQTGGPLKPTGQTLPSTS